MIEKEGTARDIPSGMIEPRVETNSTLDCAAFENGVCKGRTARAGRAETAACLLSHAVGHAAPLKDGGAAVGEQHPPAHESLAVAQMNVAAVESITSLFTV